MVKGVKITLFLADGRPDGLRIIDQANWSGRGIDFARSDWTAVRDEDDLRKPGVYILTGQEDDGNTAAYVGEADELKSRINQQYAKLDFWSRATAFITKDDTLNKASVKYLESRLISLGNDTKRARLHNGNAPSAPAMSKADTAEAEGFLEHMLPILPILGITAFERASAAPTTSDSPVLILKRSGISARGRETGEGFVVEARSTARIAEQPSIHPYMKSLRARLLAAGLLVVDGAVYRLAQDQVFGSPSTAAGVLLGRPASGPMEWRDAAGRTLKQLREAASASAAPPSPKQPPAPKGSATTSAGIVPLKLHEAMARVLRENGNHPMMPAALAAEINRQGLYRQRTGASVSSGQISARLSHYLQLFERTPAGIRLRDDAHD